MSIATKPNRTIERSAKLKGWLDSIRATNAQGLLLTDAVIDAAKDPQSPGHKHFTWNIKKAARKCWRMEANQLIRKVYVIQSDSGAKRPAFLSLLHDREQPGGGYRETSEVLSSKALKAQLELTAKSELRAWTERYQMLTGLVVAVAKAAGIETKKKTRAA